MKNRQSEDGIHEDLPSSTTDARTDTPSPQHSEPTTGKDSVMTDHTKDELQESSTQEPPTEQGKPSIQTESTEAPAAESRNPDSASSSDGQGDSELSEQTQSADKEPSDEKSSDESSQKEDAPSVSFTIVFEDDDPADDGTVPDSASANPDEGSEQVQDRPLTVGTDPDNEAEHGDSQTLPAPSHPGTARRADDAKSSDDILSSDSAQLASQAEDSPAAASLKNSKDVDVPEESSSDPLMKVSSRINAEIHRRSTLRIDQYPVLSLNKVTYFPKKSGFAILDDVDWPFYGGSLQTVLTDVDDAHMAVAGLLSGLVLPTSGSVEFRGKNLSEMEASEYRGHLVGVMLQRFASRDELSALENLVLTMEASGRNFLKPIPVIAKGWLARVDFPEARINEPVRSLAALDRRRAEIARTLCCDATVLILDEPSGGLEHQDAVTVMKLLTSLAQEQDRCVVVLTSQDDVAQYGETIYEA